MKNLENFKRNHEVKTPTEKQFGLFWSFVLLTLSVFLIYGNGVTALNLFPGFMAFMIFVVSVLKPTILKPINKVWTKLGVTMAHFTNPIILGVFFFLILTPFSIFFRLFSKNPLIKNSENVSSTWVECKEHLNTSMENQF